MLVFITTYNKQMVMLDGLLTSSFTWPWKKATDNAPNLSRPEGETLSLRDATSDFGDLCAIPQRPLENKKASFVIFEHRFFSLLRLYACIFPFSENGYLWGTLLENGPDQVKRYFQNMLRNTPLKNYLFDGVSYRNILVHSTNDINALSQQLQSEVIQLIRAKVVLKERTRFVF